MRSRRKCTLISQKPQASILSLDDSLSLKLIGAKTRHSPVKWLKASPTPGPPTPFRICSVGDPLTSTSFNHVVPHVTFLVMTLFGESWDHSVVWICLGDPSIELLVAPMEDSGPQKLFCNVWGFSPQVKWLSESQHRSAASGDIWMEKDGRVAVNSHLSISQTEWKTGKDFTCQVTDKSTQKVVSKIISLCSGKVQTMGEEHS